MELAQGLCSGIADNSFSVAVRGGEVTISFSMGVAFPRESDTDESILQRADEAMYRSKTHRPQPRRMRGTEEELLTV